LLTVAAVLTAGLAVAPALAQIESREGIALRDQIAELRYELQRLQAQVSSGRGGSVLGSQPPPPQSAGGNDVTAQLVVRVQQLEDEVRQLRGRTDELQNQLQQQTADIGKRLDDLAFQLQNPQAAAAAAAAARQAGAASGPAAPTPLTGAPPGAPQTGILGTLPAGPPGGGPPGSGLAGSGLAGSGLQGSGPRPTGPPAAAPAVPRTPELAMQEGNAALARRDYLAAEAAARQVLNNRASPRAYDAMFLLAQAQYGERQYSQAALSFDDTYNRAHRGPRAQDALLGLANSLIGLNDKSSACEALANLHAQFPTLRPEVREQVAFSRGRAGCR
jgi:TolA-binding protein